MGDNGIASEVTDFDGEKLTVMQGTYVAIYPNNDMTIEEFAVSGSELLAYPGSYEFSVAGETEVYIKAVEKEKTVINIDVDQAANIKVWYNIVTTNWIGIPVVQEVTIDLQDGANSVALDPVPETICISAVEEAVITEITVDGVAIEPDTDIPVANGMHIVVKTRKDGTDGIRAILGAEGTADVYSLDGRLVLRAVDASRIATLPAGTYIAAGRKIVVKHGK